MGRPIVGDGVTTRAGGLHFDGLDGCRALAATGVVLYHTTIAVSFYRGDVAPRWNAPLGDFAVCIFFVLSGFLLYRPFAAAHRQRGNEPGWGSFWLRRVARIGPGYWLAMAALLLVFTTADRSRPRSARPLPTFLTFTQIYRTGFATKGLDVAWTLCIEFSFYLALPLLAALGGGWRPARRADNRLRRELVLLAAMFVIGGGYRLLVIDHPPGAGLQRIGWSHGSGCRTTLRLDRARHVPRRHPRVAAGPAALPKILRVAADHPGVCVGAGRGTATAMVADEARPAPLAGVRRWGEHALDTMLRFGHRRGVCLRAAAAFGVRGPDGGVGAGGC